jgi:tetratricopeptide (TPR) repeat protein
MDSASSSSKLNITPDTDNLKDVLESARRAEQRGDWLEAYRFWDTVKTRDPGRSLAYLCCGSALRHLCRWEEAEHLLDTAVDRFPADASLAIERGWLANARRDWPAALSRWQLAREHFPENPWAYLGSIHALRASGCSDQLQALLPAAESVLAAAKGRGFDSLAALRVQLEILKVRADWAAVRQIAEQIIASDGAPGASLLLTLAQACWHLHDPDAADRAAEQALGINPSLTDAWLLRAWVATDQGEGERTLACYRKVAEINPDNARWSLQVVQLLNWLGRVKESVNELKTLCAQWPNDPAVKLFAQNYAPAAARKPPSAGVDGSSEGATEEPDEDSLRTLLQRAPGRAQRLRPLIENDPEHDVLIGELKHAATAVLVFTGGNDAITIPLDIVDHFMAPLPITCIYLKDFKRLRYLVGIESLSENYQGTIVALRRLLRTLGIHRVCAIGNCDGGFAAIRYGVELGAARILAFSTATYIPQDASARTEQARNLKRRRLAAHVPDAMSDLKPFLEASPHQAQIDLFYDQEDARDRTQALHLSGLPGVTLRALPTPVDQRLLRQFALSSADFSATLAELFGVQPAALSRE